MRILDFAENTDALDSKDRPVEDEGEVYLPGIDPLVAVLDEMSAT